MLRKVANHRFEILDLFKREQDRANEVLSFPLVQISVQTFHGGRRLQLANLVADSLLQRW